MLGVVLALMAAAADPPAPAPPPHAVSGVVVTPTPREIDKHPDLVAESAGSEGSGDYVAVWPGDTYTMGKEAKVSLSCRVDPHGLAEVCQVAAETPPGRGFGRAALELRPTFRLKPPTDADGRPTSKTLTINVTFRQPDRTNFDAAVGEIQKGEIPTHSLHDGPLSLRKITMLDFPVWAAAPSFADLLAVDPAKAGAAEGYVAEHCQVLRSGALSGCFPIKEEPRSQGFGKAADALMSKFKVAAELARASHRDQLWVDVPIRFPAPDSDEARERLVMAPAWVAGFDANRAPELFPPEAAAQGLSTGRGVVRCAIGADGALSACSPEPGDPDGLGFSEAAVKLASTMKMNLWSLDGAPVAGGTIHIPIRLNLKGSAPPGGR